MIKIIRAIEKNPDVPELTARQIKLLTELCFKQDKPGPADIVFVFSTVVSHEVCAEKIEEMVEKYRINKIVIGGGSRVHTDTPILIAPESHILHDLLIERELNAIIKTEFISTNLREAAQMLSQHTDNIDSVLVITKSHSAGRSYLTLKTFYPSIDFKLAIYNPQYENEPVMTKDNWCENNRTRSRVWGEYLRIKLYSELGHINAFGTEKLLEEISR